MILCIYLDFANQHKINQVIFKKLNYSNENYLGKTIQNKQLKLSPIEVSEIISINKFGDGRAIYIPDNYISRWNLTKKFLQSNPERYFTDGLKVSINYNEKKIIFNQLNESDWVLLRNFDLDNWKIIFVGAEAKRNNKLKQRFNSFGLTGYKFL